MVAAALDISGIPLGLGMNGEGKPSTEEL